MGNGVVLVSVQFAAPADDISSCLYIGSVNLQQVTWKCEEDGAGERGQGLLQLQLYLEMIRVLPSLEDFRIRIEVVLMGREGGAALTQVGAGHPQTALWMKSKPAPHPQTREKVSLQWS